MQFLEQTDFQNRFRYTQRIIKRQGEPVMFWDWLKEFLYQWGR